MTVLNGTQMLQDLHQGREERKFQVADKMKLRVEEEREESEDRETVIRR